MEIKPILSTIFRNTLGATLVSAQIAVTMAVLCNAGFLAFDRVSTMLRPTGLDVSNIFTADVISFGDSFSYEHDIPMDLAAIAAIDGVRAVSTINSIPLSGSGWGIGLQATPEAEDDVPDVAGNIYFIDTNGLEALGVELIEGRNFTEAELLLLEEHSAAMPDVIILTQAMADQLFPGRSALGRTVYDTDHPMEVVGIIERMQGSWLTWDGVENTMLLPGRLVEQTVAFLIRAEADRHSEIMPQVEATLASRYTDRVIRNVRSLEQYLADSYADTRTGAVVLLIIITLLVIVTGLGIVGLVSFLVSQRTKQIGTRRALGAQRWHVIRYFLIENWLVTSIGVSVGLILTMLLNYYLVQNFELPRLPLWYLPVGLAVIWSLSLAASFGPARKAAKVAPAVATRSV